MCLQQLTVVQPNGERKHQKFFEQFISYFVAMKFFCTHCHQADKYSDKFFHHFSNFVEQNRRIFASLVLISECIFIVFTQFIVVGPNKLFTYFGISTRKWLANFSNKFFYCILFVRSTFFFLFECLETKGFEMTIVITTRKEKEKKNISNNCIAFIFIEFF